MTDSHLVGSDLELIMWGILSVKVLSGDWSGMLWTHYRRNNFSLSIGEPLKSINFSFLFFFFFVNHLNTTKNLTLLLMDLVRLVFGNII